jgi:hypothetical protein
MYSIASIVSLHKTHLSLFNYFGFSIKIPFVAKPFFSYDKDNAGTQVWFFDDFTKEPFFTNVPLWYKNVLS